MVLEIVDLFDFLALVVPEHLELLVLLLEEVLIGWLLGLWWEWGGLLGWWWGSGGGGGGGGGVLH